MRQRFHYVEDRDEDFFALFPHRYDYIFADHPPYGHPPQWHTERRHPLSDRLLLQGQYLYGVRFGSTTAYALIDIDTESPYHPNCDPLAIRRLLDGLETIGLCESIICTSSYSKGLHLYFPLPVEVPSWKLASLISAVLHHAGYPLQPGQIELFPNPKAYLPEQTSLFNAHRLPLQAGSYILNQDLQPILGGRSRFVALWRYAQQQNTLTPKKLDRYIRRYVQQTYRISTKAAKFLNDLNAEIELGWTGYGQTNRLLGRIAMRTYIFHHVLSGGVPLQGESLVQEIVAIARQLPGYTDWCRHQHEIDKRAADWARCVESSAYFRYGGRKEQLLGKSLQPPDLSTSSSVSRVAQLPTRTTWNQKQLDSTRDRLSQAVNDLQRLNQWPKQTTARFRLLVQQGIGGGSLYRHKDLWHPRYLSAQETLSQTLVPTSNSLELLHSSETLNKSAQAIALPISQSQGFLPQAFVAQDQESLFQTVLSPLLEIKTLQKSETGRKNMPQQDEQFDSKPEQQAIPSNLKKDYPAENVIRIGSCINISTGISLENTHGSTCGNIWIDDWAHTHTNVASNGLNAMNATNSTSLFPSLGSNPLMGGQLGDRASVYFPQEGGNSLDLWLAQQTREPQPFSHGLVPSDVQGKMDGAGYIRQVLQQVKQQATIAKQQWLRLVQSDRHQHYHRYDQAQRRQMETFLASNDPILVQEAQQWLEWLAIAGTPPPG